MPIPQNPRLLGTHLVILVLFSLSSPVYAGEDVKALLEILLEKGVITQEEFDQKLKAARDKEEIRAFNEAQDVRRANREIDKRAEDERKFKTQIYGQVSAGYYQASNMTSNNLSANGMSDQPKGNNRVGLKVSRELNADNTVMVTLESNFSARTGAIGRDSAGYGTANSNSPGATLFDREANVRWVSKDYGTFIVGRGPNLQNDLSGAFDARQNWNFGGLKPIGRYVGSHGANGINRADKLFRYISPVWNGFNLDTGVSFGGVAGNEEKGTNYYIGGRYKNGNFEAGYNHAEVRLGGTSASSTPTSQQNVNNRVDFFAAKYTLDQLTVNAGYVVTRNPDDPNAFFNRNVTGGKVNANTWFTGAVYRFSPQLSWNFGYYSVDDQNNQIMSGSNQNLNNDVQMFATGLTYSPFKEWDFFIDYAAARRQTGATGAFTLYDKWGPDTGIPCASSTGAGCSESKSNQTGVSVGAQYKF
ncbi:MAG: porin [Burkholderiaceae bacterium]